MRRSRSGRVDRSNNPARQPAAARCRERRSLGCTGAFGAGEARTRPAHTGRTLAARAGPGLLLDLLGNPPTGVAVPQRHPTRLGRAAGGTDLEDRIGVVAKQHIGAQGDGHRSFGGGPKCVAGNAKRRRLLLHTTRVSEDRTCTGLEGQKVDVPERLPATHTSCEQPAESTPTAEAPFGSVGGSERRSAQTVARAAPASRRSTRVGGDHRHSTGDAVSRERSSAAQTRPHATPHDAAPPATVAGACRSWCCRHGAPVPPGCLRSRDSLQPPGYA